MTGPLLLILSICSTFGAVGATGTTPVSQAVNYDEIPNVNFVLGFAPPKPYKYLTYTAFALGAPLAQSITIQASSGRNAVFAPALVTGPLAVPEISSVYDGSKVASFDVKSIAVGCYAATQNGAITPAVGCTIRYTGIKTASGEEVTHDQVFKVKGANALGIALAAEKVQKTTFSGNFNGLSSLKPTILTAATPPVNNLAAHMAFDDFVYTANVKK